MRIGEIQNLIMFFNNLSAWLPKSETMGWSQNG